MGGNIFLVPGTQGRAVGAYHCRYIELKRYWKLKLLLNKSSKYGSCHIVSLKCSPRRSHICSLIIKGADDGAHDVGNRCEGYTFGCMNFIRRTHDTLSGRIFPFSKQPMLHLAEHGASRTRGHVDTTCTVRHRWARLGTGGVTA